MGRSKNLARDPFLPKNGNLNGESSQSHPPQTSTNSSQPSRSMPTIKGALCPSSTASSNNRYLNGESSQSHPPQTSTNPSQPLRSMPTIKGALCPSSNASSNNDGTNASTPRTTGTQIIPNIKNIMWPKSMGSNSTSTGQ